MNAIAELPARAREARADASAADSLQAGLLARVLDEMDHGLLLVDLGGRILHANQPGRRELVGGRALRDVEGVLSAAQPAWQAKLRQALKDAERDCRSIVEFDPEGGTLSLAFVPLAVPYGGAAVDAVLIICSRRSNCETLTVQMFARAKRLTPAEQAVLTQLCAGRGAQEIACEQGIRVSTVRTHIKNVRQKTGRGSVREIVRELSRMPQIVSSLRLVGQD
ncbi:LuxR C-terminal-related transcriptional regulator [Variovorax soli]|uniref:DNA-binding CsgD family transcriptional regulator n=1 Tax=Variovorax soli TaxID=376815 RepID=A0ABU1N8Q4_9BURK|nr:LuxR C-terminal-related transcriptional regulator [Variovorax soli]MDR6534824.1 DNA-binding CsgD family transcriptional regulator [Variovorax soli]